MIIEKIENELKNLKSVNKFVDFYEMNINREKIERLEKLLSIMTAISNVIAKRIQRGASNQNINFYKQQLLTNTWKNNELVQKHIAELG